MLTVHGVAFLSFCCCPLFICATAIFAYIVSVAISFVVTAVCVCVRVDRLLLVFTSPAKYFVCTIVLFDVFWRHFLAEPQNSRHCSPPKNVTFWAQIKSNGANNKNRGCRASKETHKRTYTHMHEMNFVWIWMQIALWMHNLQQPSRNEGGTHLSLYGLCFYLPFRAKCSPAVSSRFSSLVLSVCGWIGHITESAGQYFIVNCVRFQLLFHISIVEFGKCCAHNFFCASHTRTQFQSLCSAL